MKYIKIFALAVGMFSLVACSDDKKDYNTSAEVEVEMGVSELTTKENRGLFNVPINLVGKANGSVSVTVDVEAVGAEAAHEADLVNGNRVGNYIITTKTLNIPEGVNSVNIQINAIDDDDINDDRTFKITIVKAEGATIDKSKDSTLVTIKDDDHVPYEKLQGDWVLSWCGVYDDGAVISMPVTIDGYSEDRPNYNKVLKLTGLMSDYMTNGESLLNMNYFYDEETEDCFLEIAYAQSMGTINAALIPDYGGATVYNFGVTEDGYLEKEGYIEGKVSADRKTVEFTPDATMLISFPYGGQYLTIDGGYNLVLTRK